MASMIVDHKKVLEQLGVLLGREQKCALIISPDNKKWQEDLEETKKKTGEKFTVLVMGIFSSGKSSMINALIGEELLPTGVLPETAVIGELHYGEKKKITIYPKKGKWKGGDKPFELASPTMEEIAKYASIDNEAGFNSKQQNSQRIESAFQKIVIHWPLDILKDGVVLVDSPGLNDPFSNDYIVKGYLPKADAIIYVMSSTTAYTATDVEQLDEINKFGLRNIITGYTYYDVALRSMARKPGKVEETRRVLTSHMLKHSSLGEESIHFLSSIDGLDAKLNGDQALLVRSGYDGLEKYLGHYLVEGKGRDQVKNMAETIRIQADIMIKQATVLNEAAGKDVKNLDERIEQAQRELNTIKTATNSTKRVFRTMMERCMPQVEMMTEEYVKKLADITDLDGFEPETELASGLGRLNPFATKKKAEAVQEEFKTEFERRMNKNLDNWMASVMTPYLQEAIQESARSVEKQLQNLADRLEGINSLLAYGTVEERGSGRATSIALGLVWGILTGNWFTSGISAIYGKGAFAKALVAQAAVLAGTAGLLAAGVVITLPAFIAAAIVAQIVAILVNNTEAQLRRMKKDIVKGYREGYLKEPQNVEKNVKAVVNNVKKYINSVCDDMDAALDADVKAKEDLIDATIRDKKRSQEERDQEIKKREDAVKDLKEITEEAAQICGKYGLTGN
ncbi:hypothetical protein GPL15_19040 [Clostridium sp. MCC353]|uniref:dynamin family protein n=1 Tax=Clostridium sp. MCC353 TaxID=2592646 RepID=UPI001C028C12|nr:dynamin family protein [Clostridium sp. MCC353]MBT9778597.1 hypothetical protein [Clostridium sp. MCC353]